MFGRGKRRKRLELKIIAQNEHSQLQNKYRECLNQE